MATSVYDTAKSLLTPAFESLMPRRFPERGEITPLCQARLNSPCSCLEIRFSTPFVKGEQGLRAVAGPVRLRRALAGGEILCELLQIGGITL